MTSRNTRRTRSGETPRSLGDGRHPVEHGALALQVAHRRVGAGLGGADLGHDLEPAGDEVDEAAVDLVELAAQVVEGVGSCGPVSAG